MPKVFISYRRADSKHAAGRIGDYLIEAFGRENVFKDVDSIPLGHDFRVELTKLIPKADVLLAIIGSRWLNVTDAQGNRRLDNDADWVRVEIETALNLSIPVVPILINDAQMPKAGELPEPLAPLARLSGTRIGAEHTFRHDIGLLIQALDKTLRQTAIDATIVSPENPKPPPALDVLVAELVAGGGMPGVPAQAGTQRGPAARTVLRWGCAATAIALMGLMGIVFVAVIMEDQKPPPQLDTKWIEDLSKFKPYTPPDLEGVFSKDFAPLPSPANSGVSPWDGTQSQFAPDNPLLPASPFPETNPFPAPNPFPEANSLAEPEEPPKS